MAERPFNVTSILGNFKSLMDQVYEKACTHKIKKKNDQISTSEQIWAKSSKNYLHWKKKGGLAFHNRQNAFFFLKSKCYKSILGKAYMS